MKSIPLLLFLTLLFQISLSQNNTIKGKVDLFNPRSDSYYNIRIDAIDASTAYTNESGLFTLTFNSKKAGAPVLLNVSKKGWQVADSKSLELQIPDNPNNINNIITLCRPEECDQAIMSLYAPLRDIFETEFRIKEKILQSRINELEQDINERKVLQASLISEKALLKANNENIYNLLRTPDLNAVSSLNEEVKMALLSGKKIDSVLLLLEDNRINQIYQKALVSEKTNEIKAANKNYILKAQILIGVSEFDQAEKYYNIAYEQEEENTDILAEYGNYYVIMGQYQKATRLFENALKVTESNKTKAYLLKTLSELYLVLFEIDKSLNYLNQSIEMYQELAIFNENKYNPFIGSQLIIKNAFYGSKSELATKDFDETITIFKDLSKQDPKKYLPYLTIAQIQKLLSHLPNKNDDLIIEIEETLNKIENKSTTSFTLLNIHFLIIKGHYGLINGGLRESKAVIDSSLNLLSEINFGPTNYTLIKTISPNVDSLFSLDDKMLEPTYFVTYYSGLLTYAAYLKTLTSRFGNKDNLISCYKKLESGLRSGYDYNPSRYELLLIYNISNMSTIYASNQEFTKAFELSKEAVQNATEITDQTKIDSYSNLQATTLVNAATVNLQYLIFMENDKTIKKEGRNYAKQALRIFKNLKKKNKNQIVTTNFNIKATRKIKKQFFINYKIARLVYN
ncbi:MAG: hypothetical protein NXI20_22695 [bacterium]|nr:hypothetical protein [bacterium]